MHFTCIYKSGRTFGTGKFSLNYRASVTSHAGSVAVSFDFKVPPQGKSNPGISDAAVKSITFYLSDNEALQLAASIIAQAHHPTIHDSKASWIPPDFMPELTKNRWSRKLIFSIDQWNKSIRIENRTKYHIGRIEFELGCRISDETRNSEEHTFKTNKLVDLPPGDSSTVRIEEEDMPSKYRKSPIKILSVQAIKVTGIIPGK